MKKKGVWFGLIMAFMWASAVFAKADIQKVAPVALVDFEMPFRCTTTQSDQAVSQTIALTLDDFAFQSLQSGDALPRFAVNDYTFKEQPLDKVLAKLVESAGIKVIAPKTEMMLLTAKNVNGDLASVVQQLTDAGEMFYNYKEASKTLTLLRRADFALQVPKNKAILMSVLDALRGQDLQNISVDFEKYKIRMNVSPEELKQAKKVVRKILDDAYLLAADIKIYELLPYTAGGQWHTIMQKVLPMIATTKNALTGRAMILKNHKNSDDIVQIVKQFYQVQPLVSGQSVVPNGWQMRFNINECTTTPLPYANMSLLMKTRIHNEMDERTQITIASGNEVLTTFDITSNLNQEVVLLGMRQPNNKELLITVKFNLIRLSQKGE